MRRTTPSGDWRASSVVAALALFLAPCAARAGVAEEKLAWESRFGPFEELVQSHAVPAPNDTAKTLEELALTLGIDLVPKSRDRGPDTKQGPVKKLPDGRPKEWRAWFAKAIAPVDGDAEPVPAEVLAWHETNAGTVEQVRHVLLTWKPPAWEEDLSDGPKAPIPNLLGITHLCKVLVADALVAQSLGEAARAEADLEAAWNLATSLLQRADLISALVAAAQARSVAVALRSVEGASPAWLARLDPATFRAALLLAMRSEARFFAGLADGRWNLDEPDAGAIRRWFVRRGTAVVATRQLRAAFPVAEELDGEPLCDDESMKGIEVEAGWLEGLIPDFSPNLRSIPPRVDALGLHFELTRRVIEVRRIVRETGALPTTLPGGRTSTSCPFHAWRWSIDGATGHLEPVRVGGAGVGTWWADGSNSPSPMEATITVD